MAFEHGPEREFDLVVGADGLHSEIRDLVFGPQERFETYLGYKVAAFEAEAYRPRNELIYVLHSALHQQIGRFTMRGDRTLFLFTFADGDANIGDKREYKALLRRRFGNSGQGTALAMVAAYILAGELYRAGGDYARAVNNYQQLFAPFVRRKQKAAVRFAGFFAPKSKVALLFATGS